MGSSRNALGRGVGIAGIVADREMGSSRNDKCLHLRDASIVADGEMGSSRSTALESDSRRSNG